MYPINSIFSFNYKYIWLLIDLSETPTYIQEMQDTKPDYMQYYLHNNLCIFLM